MVIGLVCCGWVGVSEGVEGAVAESVAIGHYTNTDLISSGNLYEQRLK